jgi:hypothetical protein
MTSPICPEHGATLCYGEENGIRIYRCELGYCKVNRAKNKDGTMSEHVEYIAKTHREYWVRGDKVEEVTPHTSPWGVMSQK